MNKCSKLAVLAGAVLAFGFASCKSTPTETPAETPAETPVETPVETKDYSEANKELLAQADAAREAAVNAGAEAVNPTGYAAAETELAAQKAASESSTADLSQPLADLIARYDALKAQADAAAKKAKIDEKNLASYNQTEYDNGAKILEELSAPESNIALGTALKEKAQSADKSFQTVLTTAYKTMAKEERTSAFTAKRDADSVKASVSRKEAYDAAVADFRAGDQTYSTGNPEQALENYTKSKEAFTTLYTQISEARAKAQQAIDAAKQRVSESATVAQQADTVAPLGDQKVEGIEEEDAKLLQDDDFSSAENTQVEVDAELSE